MFLQSQTFVRASAVKDDAERSGRDDGGIELLQRTGGSVAGIGKTRQALFRPVSVQLFEPPLFHENFTADFENCRRLPFKAAGNGPNGQDILGDVIAG